MNVHALLLGLGGYVLYWLIFNGISRGGRTDDKEERYKTYNPAPGMDPVYDERHAHDHEHHTPTTRIESWLVITACVALGAILGLVDALRFSTVGNFAPYLFVFAICISWSIWAMFTVISPSRKWRIFGYLGAIAGASVLGFYVFHFGMMVTLVSS